MTSKTNTKITEDLAYFLGLITGRGKIYNLPSKPRIVINFPFKRLQSGIPFCPHCSNKTAFCSGGTNKKPWTCKTCGKTCKKPDYRIPNFDSKTQLVSEIQTTRRFPTNNFFKVKCPAKTLTFKIHENH